MSNQIQQDVDLWEIWIEFDPFDTEHFGILYIYGEIQADQKCRSLPVKKIKTLSNELTLQLPSRSSSANRTKEVLYSEPIRNLNQYTSVKIFSGNDLIATLSEIEILI